MKYMTSVGDQTFVIDVNQDDQVTVDGEIIPVDFYEIDQTMAFSLLLDHDSFEVMVSEDEGEYHVLLGGHLFHVRVEDERARRLAQAARSFVPTSGEIQVKAPMPGMVVAVSVKEGQIVKKGDVLVVLESMKMENELKAPRDGTVSGVRVQSRQSVEQNQLLITIT
jgi:biotin carboxyl carrier protein